MEDSEAANAYYRTLAEYEQTVLPVLLPLQDVDWALVRELILNHRRQQAASNQRAFFNRQNEPEYMAARFNKRRGAYPSPLIYLPHEFYPERGWCERALDRTRRALTGTLAPSQSPEQVIAEAEIYWRYNAYFQKNNDQYKGPPKIVITEKGVSLRPAWGHDEREVFWQSGTNPRQLIAEQLKAAALFLSKNESLAILLETGAPRLRQLQGEKTLLGYVWYCFDCWTKFKEYEKTPPPVTPLKQLNPAALTIELNEPEQLPAAEHPWAKIEAIAEKIELRKNGVFLVSSNRIAAAGAGFIDALLDGGILPASLTRPALYAAFSKYYGQSITADRTKPTRSEWHTKARLGLGLPDLKPPKRQA